MSRSLKETSITLGFVQVPVSVFRADQDDKLDLKTLCDCEQKPEQYVVCTNPSCGERLPEPDAMARAMADHKVVFQDAQGFYVARRYFGYQGKQAPPKRGYEWTKGQFVTLTAEEIEAAKASQKKDSIEIVKTGDFKQVASKYVLSGPYYLLPPEKANTVSKEAYCVLVEGLDQKGLTLLGYMTPRDRTDRFAIISDRQENVMMAYHVQDKRPLPYPPPALQVDKAKAAQLTSVVEGMKDPFATIESLPDPVLALLEQRVAAVAGLSEMQGIGQKVIVPQ